MREIIFEKEVNGYSLVIDNFDGRVDIVLSNGNNEIEIYLADPLGTYEHIRNRQYSLIEFKIQTTSFGSKNVLGIEKLIQKYQDAVEAVEAFEAALQDLEILEMREAQ